MIRQATIKSNHNWYEIISSPIHGKYVKYKKKYYNLNRFTPWPPHSKPDIFKNWDKSFCVGCGFMIIVKIEGNKYKIGEYSF